MTRVEFEWWREFFKLYPFDDFHRFHRPAALAGSAMASKDRAQAVKKLLSWLQPDPVDPDWSDADLRTMAALGVKPPSKD